MRASTLLITLKRFMCFVVAIPSFVLIGLPTSFAEPEDFHLLAAKLLPAVVNISTVLTSRNSSDNFQGSDGFLEDWFDGNNQPGLEKQEEALGSGFIIDATGYIVTNYHVIEGAQSISVTLYNNRTYKAKLVGSDSITDLALLKIEAAQPLPFVPWGVSADAKIGEWIIAIGNPLGLGGSVSIGIISASQRDIHRGPYDDYLQTDAAINHGNSGGPMFNVRGEVIGINSAIISSSQDGGSIGLGFAISSDLAKGIIDQLKQFGQVKRGWIGVNIQSINDELVAKLKLPSDSGALITSVVANSPAEKAGIQKDDIILKINNRTVASARILPRIVAEIKIGTKIPVVIWRDQKELTLQVEIQELQEKTTQATDTSTNPKLAGTNVSELGLIIAPLDASLRRRFDIPKQVLGLVVLNVENGSAASQKGIKAGDVITEINQKAIRQVNDIIDRLKEAQQLGHKIMTVLIIRQGDYQWVALAIPPSAKPPAPQ